MWVALLEDGRKVLEDGDLEKRCSWFGGVCMSGMDELERWRGTAGER